MARESKLNCHRRVYTHCSVSLLCWIWLTDYTTPHQIEKILRNVSLTAIKHWLKISEREHSAQNAGVLYERLAKLIDANELTPEDLQGAVLEIEENGAKRIFLQSVLNTQKIRSKEAFEKHLKSIGFSLSKAPNDTVYNPRRPTLNYVYWGNPELRVKFSEAHERVDVDLETGTIQRQNVTKFVVISAEPTTGFTTIALDAPEEVHPHKDADGKSKRALYEDYYFNKAAEILGSELVPIELGGVAERLALTNPRIFRIPYELVRTGGNCRQRYSTRSDVRDDPAHKAAAKADGDNWIYEDISGYWIPGRSAGALQRELFMQLVSRSSMLRFLADCLAAEVGYAITQVRALSEEVS